MRPQRASQRASVRVRQGTAASSGKAVAARPAEPGACPKATLRLGFGSLAALIAGILGYQVGPAPQTVQRCASVQGAPAHYEVTYNFRGSPRTVQMAAPPANNRVIVNARGEPRM